MSEIPSVKVLEAISPANSGTGENELRYNNLARSVGEYALTNHERTREVWGAELGSLEELSKAKQLASEYLLKTADKLVASHGRNRDLWADRFTQATIELYGQPEVAEVTQLLSAERTSITQLVGKEDISQPHLKFLLNIYGSILPDKPEVLSGGAEIEQEKSAIRQYGEVLLEKYQPLFGLVDSSEQAEFSPTDLRSLFEVAIDWLKEEDDADWGEWAVVDSDGTSLSVNTANRKIKIASRREAASAQDTRGLIAHELLVHALRGKNGYKTGNKKLATGLAGYLDAEEGLGILAEEAVNGKLPEKAYDRYVDIALALGTIDGVQRTRKEVFQISFARQLVREQVKGTFKEAGLMFLERKVWGHVDRIYRGGPGDSLGSKQAVFTKDIAYYRGYKQMARYITKQMAIGKSAPEIFNYLSQAKFDPENPQHIKYLAETEGLNPVIPTN